MNIRKLLVLLGIVALFTMLAACASPTPEPTKLPAPAATTAPAASTKPFAGTTLRVVGANHPWAESIKPMLADFEAKSGIKVTLELYGEDQLNQKLTTEFTAGNSDIDAFMQRPLQEAKVMAQNKWYVDLTKYAKADAAYGFDDLMPGAIGTEMVGAVLTGIPIVTEQEVLYYRKDLLEKAGLKPPKTLDELKVAAEKLTDKKAEVYGFVARGQRSPAVTQFSSFLYSYGGDWFNLETRKATVDTPEAIAAFKFYGDLLRNYGPPGTTLRSCFCR